MHANAKSATHFRFTHKILDELPPHDRKSPRAAMEYTDTECTGLRFSKGKSGRCFWFFRYRWRTRKCLVKLGEYPGMTVKQARDRGWEMRAMLVRGEDPRTLQEKNMKAITIREFIDQHYLPHAKATTRRPDVIISRLNTGTLKYFGDRYIDSLTTREVQQFHNQMREKISATTANRHLATLKAMLNLAVRWEMLEKNPCVGIKKFQEPTGRERYLSRDEVKRFLAACDSCANVTIASGLRMLLFTGLRSKEVFHLPWSDVDFENRSIILRTTKAGKARRVHLSSAAWAEVELMQERHDGKHPYVFPGYHARQPVREPHRCFREILKVAEIEEFRIHDLRHTHASYLVQSGATLFEVQKALGHSTSDMTMRYAHLADGALRDRAEVAAQRLTGTDG